MRTLIISAVISNIKTQQRSDLSLTSYPFTHPSKPFIRRVKNIGSPIQPFRTPTTTILLLPQTKRCATAEHFFVCVVNKRIFKP
jgi:hypothetical protein